MKCRYIYCQTCLKLVAVLNVGNHLQKTCLYKPKLQRAATRNAESRYPNVRLCNETNRQQLRCIYRASLCCVILNSNYSKVHMSNPANSFAYISITSEHMRTSKPSIESCLFQEYDRGPTLLTQWCSWDT